MYVYKIYTVLSELTYRVLFMIKLKSPKFKQDVVGYYITKVLNE